MKISPQRVLSFPAIKLVQTNPAPSDKSDFARTLKQKTEPNKDKHGNFEIQRLMSSFNQAEQLASSVLKKQEDTQNGATGKIG